MAGVQGFSAQFQLAQHHRELIVHIVGGAAGKGTNQFPPLAGTELLPQGGLLLGHAVRSSQGLSDGPGFPGAGIPVLWNARAGGLIGRRGPDQRVQGRAEALAHHPGPPSQDAEAGQGEGQHAQGLDARIPEDLPLGDGHHQVPSEARGTQVGGDRAVQSACLGLELLVPTGGGQAVQALGQITQFRHQVRPHRLEKGFKAGFLMFEGGHLGQDQRPSGPIGDQDSGSRRGLHAPSLAREVIQHHVQGDDPEELTVPVDRKGQGEPRVPGGHEAIGIRGPAAFGPSLDHLVPVALAGVVEGRRPGLLLPDPAIGVATPPAETGFRPVLAEFPGVPGSSGSQQQQRGSIGRTEVDGGYEGLAGQEGNGVGIQALRIGWGDAVIQPPGLQGLAQVLDGLEFPIQLGGQMGHGGPGLRPGLGIQGASQAPPGQGQHKGQHRPGDGQDLREQVPCDGAHRSPSSAFGRGRVNQRQRSRISRTLAASRSLRSPRGRTPRRSRRATISSARSRSGL